MKSRQRKCLISAHQVRAVRAIAGNVVMPRGPRKAKNIAKPKSGAFEAVHSIAAAMLKVGGIDKKTMREFDEACLTIVPEYKANDIKRMSYGKVGRNKRELYT